MRVIASSTACSTPRRYATSQDRLLRREYGVRLRRSGRSEQDDPSINDHARGRLARRTATSRFSRRVFQDHASFFCQCGNAGKKNNPISTEVIRIPLTSPEIGSVGALRSFRYHLWASVGEAQARPSATGIGGMSVYQMERLEGGRRTKSELYVSRFRGTLNRPPNWKGFHMGNPG
jgi:hypothetical protein